jgi:hypothetical protein
MTWEIEYTNQFEEWWLGLEEDEQDSIDQVINLLEELGPSLDYRYSSKVYDSIHSRMRELRIQHRGDPYRVLYAFDPRRVAILLIGGNKTGDDLWYSRFVPVADRLYDEHLIAIDEEGQA